MCIVDQIYVTTRVQWGHADVWKLKLCINGASDIRHLFSQKNQSSIELVAVGFMFDRQTDIIHVYTSFSISLSLLVLG